VAGSFNHSNEPYVVITYREFLDQLSDYQLLEGRLLSIELDDPNSRERTQFASSSVPFP
jgi:hypothetical protein